MNEHQNVTIKYKLYGENFFKKILFYKKYLILQFQYFFLLVSMQFTLTIFEISKFYNIFNFFSSCLFLLFNCFFILYADFWCFYFCYLFFGDFCDFTRIKIPGKDFILIQMSIMPQNGWNVWNRPNKREMKPFHFRSNDLKKNWKFFSG